MVKRRKYSLLRYGPLTANGMAGGRAGLKLDCWHKTKVVNKATVSREAAIFTTTQEILETMYGAEQRTRRDMGYLNLKRNKSFPVLVERRLSATVRQMRRSLACREGMSIVRYKGHDGAT